MSKTKTPRETSTATVSQTSPQRDPLGPFEHAVIALFDGALSEVTFPGIDRAVLGDATQKTLDAQLVVEAAERELDLARRALDERATELAKMAKKAVAFARVLADDDASLSEQLDAISPRSMEANKGTRKRRARTDEPMLPTLTEGPTESAVEEESIAAE